MQSIALELLNCYAMDDLVMQWIIFVMQRIILQRNFLLTQVYLSMIKCNPHLVMHYPTSLKPLCNFQ